MNVRALVAGGAAFAVTAGAIEALKAAGKAEGGGLFGPGTLQADLNILLELLLVAGLTFGTMLARRGSVEAHRLNQTVWVMVNTALVVCIMAGSMAAFKIPSLRALRDVGNALTVLHALVGTFTVLAGIWLVLQMNDALPTRLHVGWWKGLMRATLAGYWLVLLLGLATYYYWYAH
jgi:hypothetical protein